MSIDKLKYPIGKFEKPENITEEILDKYIGDIESLPKRLKEEVDGLSNDQLDTPYRLGGWTIRQVVNHCADSHMNSLIRFKLTLTEDKPVIKPYFEDRWAELADSKNMPIEPAIKMIEGLHERWVILLKSLTQEELGRTYIHPEQGRKIRLDVTIGLYAWHCNHHLAHITGLKKSKNW